jgi:predicted O-linked N-acetylglucosamine transferase (SPINDLY family)
VDDSHLLMLRPETDHAETILQMLEREGVSRERVEMKPRCSRGDYLSLYYQMDIALDTVPYNGHTTSLDALWMGVPVVTLAGARVAGRAGVSQLTNLGLTDLIARTPEEFVNIAAGLAADRVRVRELHRTLRQRMKQSPLMDAERFARGMESAVREMWRRYCAGE